MAKFLNLIQREKKALREFKKQINQKLAGEVLELKLFGSKARGDSRKDSDIDILLVLKKVSKRNKNIVSDITFKLFLKYGVDLSVKIFSEKEFEDLQKLQIPFMLNIQREARAI